MMLREHLRPPIRRRKDEETIKNASKSNRAVTLWPLMLFPDASASIIGRRGLVHAAITKTQGPRLIRNDLIHLLLLILYFLQSRDERANSGSTLTAGYRPRGRHFLKQGHSVCGIISLSFKAPGGFRFQKQIILNDQIHICCHQTETGGMKKSKSLCSFWILTVSIHHIYNCGNFCRKFGDKTVFNTHYLEPSV